LGAYVHLRDSERKPDAVGLLIFFVLYTGMHCFYAVPLEKHVYPVLWIIYFFFTAGLFKGLTMILGVLKRKVRKTIVIVASIVIGIILPGIVANRCREDLHFLGADRLRPVTLLNGLDPDSGSSFGPESIHGSFGLHSSAEGDTVNHLYPPFEHVGGFCYSKKIQGYMSGDLSNKGFRSGSILCENGIPLPFPHALHEDIKIKGMGRYSLWQDDSGHTTLLFSTLDNTNPGINGKGYFLKGRQEVYGHLTVYPIFPAEDSCPEKILFEAAGPALFDASVTVNNKIVDEKRIKLDGYTFGEYYLSLKKSKFEDEGDNRIKFDFQPLDGTAALDQFMVVSGDSFGYMLFLLLALLLNIAIGCFIALSRNPSGFKLFYGTILMVFFSVWIIGSVSDQKRFHEHFRVNYGQQYKVGEWYRKNFRPGDKLLMANQHIVQYAAGLNSDWFAHNIGPFEGKSCGEIRKGLIEKGVTVLVYDSDPPEPWMITQKNLRKCPFSSYGTLVKIIRVGDRKAEIYRMDYQKEVNMTDKVYPSNGEG
jgi:hypothetical protein